MAAESLDEQTNSDEITRSEEGGHGSPILVFQASSDEEAEVVRATLEASGIPARLFTSGISPVLGGLNTTSGLGVYVKHEDYEAALTLLEAPPPSDRELEAEAISNQTPLE